MKRQENRAVIAWRGAASAGLVSSADRAYMKTPSLVLHSYLWTKCVPENPLYRAVSVSFVRKASRKLAIIQIGISSLCF